MRAETVPGLEWKRYGAWCAHLFAEGVQVCSTKHDWTRGGIERPAAEPTVITELTTEGRPYGKICQRCEKWFRERMMGCACGGEPTGAFTVRHRRGCIIPGPHNDPRPR